MQFLADGVVLDQADPIDPATGIATSPSPPLLPAGAGTVTAVYSGDSFHGSVTATTTQTVNTAHLTVTADSLSRSPGSPNPALTYTIGGFVNSDTAAVVSGSPVLSTSATISSPAGTYPITVTVGTLWPRTMTSRRL